MHKLNLVGYLIVGLFALIGINWGSIAVIVKLHGGTEHLFGILMYISISILFTIIGTVVTTFAIVNYRYRERNALWEKFQVPK